MKSLAVVLGIAACLLSGAALAVSVNHAGPRGPQGPAGRNTVAIQQRYGICWDAPLYTQTWSDGSSSMWVSGVTIEQPQYVSGVYQCPQGETFVSIVPLAGK